MAPESRPPTKESSEFIVIKILGGALFFTIAGLIAIPIVQPDFVHFYTFSHIALGLAAALVGVALKRIFVPSSDG